MASKNGDSEAVISPKARNANISDHKLTHPEAVSRVCI